MDKPIEIVYHCTRCYTAETKRVKKLTPAVATALTNEFAELGWKYVGDTLLCPECALIEATLTDELRTEKDARRRYVGESHENDPIYEYDCPNCYHTLHACYEGKVICPKCGQRCFIKS